MKRVGRPPTRRNVVLVELAKAGEATAAALGTDVAYLDGVVRTGFIRRAGVIQSGSVGRPAVVFKLTRKGAGRARTLAKAAA